MAVILVRILSFCGRVTARGHEDLASPVGISVSARIGRRATCQECDMKKYVRAVLADLKGKTKKKENSAMPQDLENQILSKDSQQKVRQLDYQAQKNEERLS
jgi:hypothetical protein